MGPCQKYMMAYFVKKLIGKCFCSFSRFTEKMFISKNFQINYKQISRLENLFTEEIFQEKLHFNGALVYENSSTIPTSKGKFMDFHSSHRFCKSRICSDIEKYHLTISIKMLQRKEIFNKAYLFVNLN